MGHDLDGPLHSPSGSNSQPLDFMGAGLHLDGEEEGDTTGTGKPSAAPLELPDGQPGSWDGFLIDVDQEDTQDSCTPAGSCALNQNRSCIGGPKADPPQHTSIHRLERERPRFIMPQFIKPQFIMIGFPMLLREVLFLREAP